MSDSDKINAIAALRDYVNELRNEIRELREKVTQLRIDHAVTKTKLTIYVAIIVFAVSTVTTLGVNILLTWLRTKLTP